MSKTDKFLKKYLELHKTPKILLGASFMSSMHRTKKTSHNFKQLMGVKVLLYATSCSIKAADFGDQLPDVVLKTLMIQKFIYTHRGRCAEYDCLQALVEDGNPEGYMVATRENADIEAFQQLEKVPIVCFEGSKFIVKNASEIHKQLVETDAAHEHNGLRNEGRDARA